MPFDPSLLFLGLMFVLVFMVFQRGRGQRRELAQVQSSLAPGIEVMTASGLMATVIAVEDDVVTLETAPGQHSRWDRRAVARIITPPAEDSTGASAESAAAPSEADPHDPA